MNENELKRNWQIVQGRVREKWGTLTDQDFQVIAGERDQLVGRLRERKRRSTCARASSG